MNSLVADTARSGAQRHSSVQADCKELAKDVAAAQKLPAPPSGNAFTNWPPAVAFLLNASQRCNTLVDTARGAEFDSVLNTATGGQEGLKLVAQELGTGNAIG